MTLIIVTKTNEGHSMQLQNRVASINNEPIKASKKVVENYFNRLANEKQLAK